MRISSTDKSSRESILEVVDMQLTNSPQKSIDVSYFLIPEIAYLQVLYNMV